MKVTKPYFVHITTSNPEGPILFGLPKPEPVSKNAQIVTAGYANVKPEPWNKTKILDNRPTSYKMDNRDGRIPAFFKN